MQHVVAVIAGNPDRNYLQLEVIFVTVKTCDLEV